MTVGVPLSDLVRGVRAESGKSLNVALGVAERDSIVYQIQSKQEQLYYDYDWPALLTNEAVGVTTGTALYTYPTTIAFDFINDVWVSEDGVSGFTPVTYGIGPNEYNASALTETGWPVQKWRIAPGPGTVTQRFEVWPVPSQAGMMTFYGRRALMPLVADSDISTLDGTLIVLFVAADILARQKAEDAKLKLSSAQRHLRNLARRQGSNKQNPIILGGGLYRARTLRPGLDYIPS